MNKSLFDLQIWNRSKELAKKAYEITDNDKFKRDRGFRDQVRRALISISSNIAEWYYRGTKNEFKYFLRVAKWSCGEAFSQFIIAKELGFVDMAVTIDEELNILSKMIGKLIGSIK